MSSYEAKYREPIETSYRGYKIVSMAPAASGGLVLLQTLNILENFNLGASGHNSAKTIHILLKQCKELTRIEQSITEILIL